MNAESVSGFELVLGLLPFLVGGAAFVFYLALNSWRKNSIHDLEFWRSELRQIQKRRDQIQRGMSSFATEEEEPFKSLAARASEHLLQLDQSIHVSYRKYDQLRTGVNQLKQFNWKLLPRLPWLWMEIRRQINSQIVELQTMRANLEEASGIADELHKQGWAAARQSREILEQFRQASHSLEEIGQVGIYGEAYDQALQNAKQWQTTLLAQIPVIYFSGEESAVDLESDRVSTVKVYRILNAARPTVEDVIAKAQLWASQRQTLTQAIVEAQGVFSQVWSVVTDLEKQAVGALQWDKSRNLVDMLKLQIEKIGAPDKARTVEALQEDLNIAQRVIARLRTLSTRCQAVQQQRADLLLLREAEELRRGEEWSRSAMKLMAEITRYDAENWPKSDKVSTIIPELQQLGQAHTAILPKFPSTALKETELENLLAATKQLSEHYQKLRQQVASVHTRFIDLQEIERSAREPVERAEVLLNQLIPLFSSNSFLQKAAGVEPARLAADLEQIRAEFAHPERGGVEKKAQKASATLRKVEQSCRRWLLQLEDDLNERKEDLAETQEILSSYVSLDEPSLLEIKNLLPQAPGQAGAPTAQSQPGAAPLAEIANRLRQGNDEWQRCISVSRAIEEVAGPVMERYRKAEKNRKIVLDNLEKADELVPEEPKWPPTSQRLYQERYQAQNLEKRWQSLREQRARALQLVTILSDLSEQYHDLAMRITNILGQADHEIERVRQLEHRLDESIKLWRLQLRANQGKAQMVDGVEKLLGEAGKELEQVKSRYARGGLQYNQAYQQLRGICRKLDEALIPYEGNQFIDINGVLQRRL